MLYLHIGSNKAGSSSIQRFLKENRKGLPIQQLETFGIGPSWRIAAATNTEASQQYFVENRQRIDPSEFDKFRFDFWPAVEAEVSVTGATDYVASSEFIFSVFLQ